MDEDILRCSICCQDYDDHERQPLIIPFCGHALCSFCIEKIKINNPTIFCCPFCKTSKPTPDSFLKNFSIISLIEKKPSQSPDDQCDTHNSKIDLVCFECKKGLCVKCAFEDDHSSHKLFKARDLFASSEKVKLHVQQSLNILEKALIDEQNGSEVQKSLLSNSIEEGVNSIIVQMLEAKNILIEKVQNNSNKNKNEGLYTKLKDDISILKENFERMQDSNQVNSLKNAITILDIGSKIENAKNLLTGFSSKHSFQKKHSSHQESFSKISQVISALLYQNKPIETKLKTFFEEEILRTFTITSIGNTLLIQSKKLEEKNTLSLNEEIIPSLNEASSLIIDCRSMSLTQEQFHSMMNIIMYTGNSLKSLDLNFYGLVINGEFFEDFFTCMLYVDLEELTINFQNAKMSNRFACKKMFRSIAKQAALKSLSFNFKKFVATGMDDRFMNGLAEALSELENITSLSLNFETCSSVSDRGLSLLFQAISKLKNLGKLELLAPKSQNISPKALVDFSIMIKENLSKSLRKLEVSFPSDSSKKETESFFECFSALILTSFDLKIGNIIEANDDTLKKLTNSIKLNEGLQSLSLNFPSSYKLSDSSLILIAKSLMTLNLKKFEIDLSEIKTFTLIDSFCENLTSKIQELKFSLSRCKNLRLLKFPSMIKIFSDLRSLKLKLDECNLEYSFLPLLSESLRFMPQLIFFDLYLDYCKNITDISIGYFADSLQRIKSLNFLSLNVSFCPNLTDKGLIILLEASVSHANIERVCIKADGLNFTKFLSQFKISSIPSQKKLSLSLNKSQNLDFEALDALVTCLILFELKSLKLQIRNCPKLEKEKIEQALHLFSMLSKTVVEIEC